MSWINRMFKKEPAPEPPVQGIANFDFIRTFPHVFWVSNVGYDDRAPEGFRYKVLTVRHEPEMKIELILLRESVNGQKIQLARMEAPIEKFGATGQIVQQLGQDKAMTFEEFDLSKLRTFDEFEAKAIEIGWAAESQ